LSHLSCVSTKSNLYLVISLDTVVSESDIYRLVIFHLPHLISVFHCLGLTCIRFVTRLVLRWGVFCASPLVGCLRLFIQCMRSYHPCWKLFLHPQLVGAPYRDERDPLVMFHVIFIAFYWIRVLFWTSIAEKNFCSFRFSSSYLYTLCHKSRQAYSYMVVPTSLDYVQSGETLHFAARRLVVQIVP
jgi:hypothetical protein